MTTSGLPESWAVSPLGRLGVWNGGGTPTKSNPAFWKGDIPWVSPKDIKVARLWNSSDHVSTGAIAASATTVIPKGSVLLVTRSGILAHTLPIATNEVPLAINQDLKAITPFPGIDAEYLAWTLRGLERRILKECSKHGTTVHSVEVPRLQAFEVPVAPRQEQHRIVAKIEELFSELDKGIESLKTARRQLEVYRQSVLKHAFEGKLTAQWREENKDKLETPDRLLARIKQERRASYEVRLEEWSTASARCKGAAKRVRTPRKPRLSQWTRISSSEPAVEDDGLPASWMWAPVGLLVEVVSGATPKGLGHVEGGEVPFYKVSDMNSPGNETRMNTAVTYLSEARRSELGLVAHPTGTIIFPKRGGAILTNKKRLLSRSACFDLNTMGAINRTSSVSTDYLWYWFQSLDLANIYDGSNVPQINNKDVEPLRMPVCSTHEQAEIVRMIEKVLSINDQMKSVTDKELWRVATLRQTVLTKAFSGDLVAQDPNDEPASMLLKRIKAEKAAQSKDTGRKRRRGVRTTS